MELFRLLGTIAIENEQANRALDETANQAEDTSTRTSMALDGIGRAALGLGKLVVGAGGALRGAWIAAIEGRADCEEMQDELLDRFGEIPKSAAHLLRIALMRANAHRRHVTEIRGVAGEIKISLKQDAPVKVENMDKFLKTYGTSLQFVTTGQPGFVLRYPKHGLVEKDEELILDKTEQLLLDMEVLFG